MTLWLPLAVPVMAAVLAAQVPMVQTQARDARLAQRGAGEIRGTLLTEGDDPQPVRRAEVRATLQGAAPRTVHTDSQGRFVFANLPNGRYTLEASKPGYVRAAFGARRHDRPGIPVTVDDANRAHDLQWRLARGAVITGRVVDEFGYPAQGARLTIQQVRVVNGERTLSSLSLPGALQSEVADDRGEFRLYGLPAGDYLVSATPRGIGVGDIRRMTDAELHAAQQALQSMAPATTDTTPPQTLGFSQIFYPGVLASDDAMVVSVQAGDVRTGVDFSVPLVRTATVEGFVVTPGGVAPQSVQLTLTPRRGGSTVTTGPAGTTMVFTQTVVAGGTRRVNPDGTFSLSGITPGEYTLQARVLRDEGAHLWATADVSVDGYPVAGLSLALRDGLTVSGRIDIEADGVDVPADLSRARITFVPTGGGGPVMLSASQTSVGGNRFTAGSLIPGPMRVVGALSTPEATWTLKSAVIKGQDALDVPFVLEPDDQITDAVFTFTNRTQQVSGTLIDAAQRPAPDYTIVVFPEDRTLWGSSRRVRTARPGTDGRFTVANLPAGRYRIAAVTDIGPEETQDRALLEELLAASLAFTLADGEQKVQDLRIR